MNFNDMLYELLADVQFVYAYDTKNKEAMSFIAFQKFGDKCYEVLKELLPDDF